MSELHVNSSATDESHVATEDPDLEDGEIDDDDEDLQNTMSTANTVQATKSSPSEDKNSEMKSVDRHNVHMVKNDLVNDSGSPMTPLSLKSKKSHIVEDDHASSIENAIATALKKKGIEPPIPKILESRNEMERAEVETFGTPGYGQSRSSRRRKRKKQRDEKEKERKEKKKHRYESPDRVLQSTCSQPTPANEDFDEYEMLNVRGGSPPQGNTVSASAVGGNEHYDSGDESVTSYDSYDSQHRFEIRRPPPSSANKSRESRKTRRERVRARDDCDDRNGRGGEKRNRRESANDDKQHRQEPRKLELCKFYLMECCAKKDKCSYMHSDFPCKYYYLGMDCVFGSSCKFSHGKPLTEQLRNILLKHLETAPKEILGNFKRICRDTAIAQMAVRHSVLCKEFGVENTLTSITSNLNNVTSSRNSNSGSNGDHHHINLQQQAPSSTGIPSLLDIVIKPPTGTPNIGTSVLQNQQKDKQRKSRWCDINKTISTDKPIPTNSVNVNESPKNNVLSHLELKNLTGILSADHIEKLSQLGVVTLEQVYQLTFAQLSKIGLTIAEISEIQVNANNMAKLGVNSSDGLPTTMSNVSSDKEKQHNEKISSGRDVDMRFLPSVTSTLGTVVSANQAPNATEPPEKIVHLQSNSNSNSSVVMVDYCQYVKDSNLFLKGDFLDDEKDEEQLVIDDDNNDESEEVNDAKEGADSTAMERVQLSDIPTSQTLKNPFSDSSFNSYNDLKERHDPRIQSSALDPIGSSSILAMSKGNLCPDNPEENISESIREIQNRDESKLSFNIRSIRSRPETPTRCSFSASPDSRSPDPPVYERQSMYDFYSKNVNDDSSEYVKSTKFDKDMRLHRFQDSANSDIDLRLPFQPVTNYIPATEIDASITSHLPVVYEVCVVDIPKPNFSELRQSFTSDQTNDPRLRRIRGLPELSKTNTAVAMSRALQSTSTIASPESEGSFYTPTSITTSKEECDTDSKEESDKTSKLPTTSGLRQDPRRAAAAAATANVISNATTTKTTSSSAAQKQNMEIRNLLQKSVWYKNLNSNFKIMVNQQLALVSTELKKFHQDPSPEKIFDIQFIVNNPYLQRILTNLEIYIDENGEVAYVENEQQQHGNLVKNSGNNILPNLNIMPPNMQQQQHQQEQQMEFLRNPPPGLPSVMNMQNSYGGPHPAQGLVLPAFSGGSPHVGIMSNTRPSLLGMPPVATGNNPFNPFTNVSMMDINNTNFPNGPVGGILGGPTAYGNFGNGNVQRHFPNQRHNRNRRTNNSYVNKGGAGGNKQ